MRICTCVSKEKVHIFRCCKDSDVKVIKYQTAFCNFRFFFIVIWYLLLSEYDINPPDIHVQD